MSNSWSVIWIEEGKRYRRIFPGEMPRESGAIAYGKKLKERGIAEIHFVSRVKAFPPPRTQLHTPEVGMIWCPYCVKWRFFVEGAIRRDGLLGPSLWRCPICTISIRDAWIRHYNVEMIIKLDARTSEKKITNKQIKKAIRRR